MAGPPDARAQPGGNQRFVLAFSAKKPLGLLFVPGKAIGEDLYFAPSVLRLQEDRELSVFPFPLE
jgi:hypothetical protein